MIEKEYLDIEHQYYKTSDPRLFDQIVAHNKELIKDFPFLVPCNVFTGEIGEDYDYTFTWLDDMLPGWRINFGLNLMQEIKDRLIENNALNEFRFFQIKEKWGMLRVYSNRDDLIRDIVDKYEMLSATICCECGEPATHQTKGWILNLCDACDKDYRGE